jgi:hypothetical protein
MRRRTMRMSLSALVMGALVLGVMTEANANEPVTLTEVQLDQVRAGEGLGVATAITTGGTTEVLNAVPGIVESTAESGLVATGHGQITSTDAQGM